MGVRRVGALSRDTGGVGETSKDVPSGALRSHASLEEPWMMLKSSSRRIAPTSVDINPPTTLIPSEGPLLVGQHYPMHAIETTGHHQRHSHGLSSFSRSDESTSGSSRSTVIREWAITRALPVIGGRQAGEAPARGTPSSA